MMSMQLQNRLGLVGAFSSPPLRHRQTPASARQVRANPIQDNGSLQQPHCASVYVDLHKPLTVCFACGNLLLQAPTVPCLTRNCCLSETGSFSSEQSPAARRAIQPKRMRTRPSVGLREVLPPSAPDLQQPISSRLRQQLKPRPAQMAGS
jgi:hypothetical protein